MGNINCLGERPVLHTPSLKSSKIGIPEELPDPDQLLKIQINNNVYHIRQKYGHRSCIEEEDTSSFRQSVLSTSSNQLFQESACNSEIHKLSVSNCNNTQMLTSKQIRRKRAAEIIIEHISLSNPQGERIEGDSKIVIRHINSELNLHSHFRRYENGSKLQEVSACFSRSVHDHDFWAIQISENCFQQLRKSNRLWSQISKLQESPLEDQSNILIHPQDNLLSLKLHDEEDKDSDLHPQLKYPNKTKDNLQPSERYIQSSSMVILQHVITQTEMSAGNINNINNTQQVYCDKLCDNYSVKEQFLWKIIIQGEDSYLRDNSIVQIVHALSGKPLQISKQKGILTNTLEVVCGINIYQEGDPHLNDFWIVNKVQEQCKEIKQDSMGSSSLS